MGIVTDRFNNLVAVEYTFSTMNNVLDPIHLDLKSGECSLLQNVDVINGGVTRRDGYSLTVSGVIHSGWNSPIRDIAFYVKNGNLVLFDGITESVLTRVTGACIFEDTGSEVLFCDAARYGYIKDKVVTFPQASNNEFKASIPCGQALCFYNGRVYVAVDNVLYCSDPFSITTCDIRQQVVGVFDGRITIVNKVDDGLLVCTDKEIIFLSGADPVDGGFQVLYKANYGAVKGTDKIIKNKIKAEDSSLLDGTGVIFCSYQGICFIGNGGSFVNLTQNYYTYDYGANGAAIIRYKNGGAYYIANVDATNEAFNQDELPTIDVDTVEY